MTTMKQWLAGLVSDEHGQAMVEYPLIIALVSVVAVTVLGTLGSNVITSLTNAANKLTTP
jgi:Flp pilus assembly pilin Flp